MAKYILVYTLGGFADDGGGTYTQEFAMDEQKLHATVEQLIIRHKDNITIVYSGFLQTEYKYKTIEYATSVEAVRVY